MGEYIKPKGIQSILSRANFQAPRWDSPKLENATGNRIETT